MRHAKILLLLALMVCAVTVSRASTLTNSLVWHNATGRVDADVRGEALWPLLEGIAHQTGWRIFVEPGTTQTTDAKFSGLPASEALRKLLGDLNFALVPKTNEPSQLYVFTTRMENATRPVRAAEKPVVTKQKHVANELIVKLKPGADIDAIAKSIGAKVVGRDDKLGIYRLEFPDAAATDAALAKLQSNSDVVAVEYNYILDPPVTPQKIANAPVGPVSLTLNPPGDSGRVIVGLVDTHLQSMGSDLDQFMLKQISITGDTPVDSTDPTHATSMAETILRAMAAQGGSTSAQILSVDVYGNSETATTWNLLLGIQQAINAGANPINLSLGGTGESTIMRDFIEQAVGKGIIFIAAAGNQPVSTPTLPAAFPGVYAVAATQGGQLAAYSNFGSFIAMALPGSSVVYLGNQAFLVQGTSPATAYATGIAAGTKSATSMTWAQILAAMQQKFPVPTK
ncbi:MAG TPA: S8 family serine peptidase [Candidatus Limnocylindrales bacterium]|nr:S8 family serine peptidase [Candidatus Limnocylindrales bacterium]